MVAGKCISRPQLFSEFHAHLSGGPKLLHFLKKILLIYLRDREKALAEGGAEEEGEAASLLSRTLDMGLHPKTLRS